MPSPSNFGTSSRTLGTTLFSLEHSAPSSCSFFLFSFFSLLFVFPFSHFKHSAPSSFPPSCARLQLLYNIIEYYRILNYKKKIATSATVPHPLMHRLAGSNAPCDLSGSAWSYRIRFDSSRSETDGAGRSNEIKE
jgi:hypothetical protein